MDIESTLEKFDEEDLFSWMLRYSLFLSAIVQLIFLGSAVFLPYEEHPDTDIGTRDEQKQTAEMINAARRQHKIRKLEKKKRR